MISVTTAMSSSLLRVIASSGIHHHKLLHTTPMLQSGPVVYNTIINFVPQQEAWVIERMGKYRKILDPGLNILIPFLDQIKYIQSLKEIAIGIPEQEAITIDNVQLKFDAVLYLRVVDPYKASYGVEDPEFAISQLAQTTMRSEVGKISLDTVFKERTQLNASIVDVINAAADPWGLTCLRYEIKTIRMPDEIERAMRMQVEAERMKRADILRSEGQRQAAINTAEGDRQARILQSEAQMQEQINVATGLARAIELEAEARKIALDKVGKALMHEGGSNAASLVIAEKYVEAFHQLAKQSNTLLLPADTANVSAMVAQAMTVFNRITTEGQGLNGKQLHQEEGAHSSSPKK